MSEPCDTSVDIKAACPPSSGSQASPTGFPGVDALPGEVEQPILAARRMRGTPRSVIDAPSRPRSKHAPSLPNRDGAWSFRVPGCRRADHPFRHLFCRIRPCQRRGQWRVGKLARASLFLGSGAAYDLDHALVAGRHWPGAAAGLGPGGRGSGVLGRRCRMLACA
jgi:hypothetical protein